MTTNTTRELENRENIRPRNRSIKKIVVLMAMTTEAEPVVSKLQMTVSDSPFAPCLPMKVYTCRMGGSDVILVTNGISERFGVDRVATQPAALSAWESIRVFSPDIVISAGTAGGFRQAGAKIGDVYVSTESIKYHDRRISIEGLHEYGMGSFPCCEVPKLVSKLSLKTGIVSTGNSLDLSKDDLEQINRNGATIKDMEAAAIAEVAELTGVPFMAVKSISDRIDDPVEASTQFVKNLELASQNLAAKLSEILVFLDGRRIEEL